MFMRKRKVTLGRAKEIGHLNGEQEHVSYIHHCRDVTSLHNYGATCFRICQC